MHPPRRTLTIACIALGVSLTAGAAPSSGYYEIDSFAVPTNAVMMAYSPAYGTLILKNTASAVVSIRVATRQATTRLANTQFTDISLAPSGRYLFAADYGGENIGYGSPANPQYVHRLDLANTTWDIRTAYIAGNVQAVSDTQLILKSRDQWVTFTNNSWGPGLALTVLNSSNGSFAPGYYALAYDGDFRYDFRTGRLVHAEPGGPVTAFKLVNNEFVKQEGGYGSSSGSYGGGSTAVLATDGSAFYTGPAKLDPLDVSHVLRTFPESIYGANGEIALGNGKVYDANTGALLMILPFSTTVYAMNPSGGSFWAFDPATTTAHHYSALPAPAAYSDLEFTALTPCRLYDSRASQGGAGRWTASSTHTINVGPVVSYAFEGGSPGDCGVLAGMVSGQIAAIMASVSTVNQAGSGFLTFYPTGATNPFPTSVTQAFQAGSVQTSFVIMPTDANPPVYISGYTTAGTDAIIDIVGYFTKPKSAALECYYTDYTTTSIAGGGDSILAGGACSAGYSYIETICQPDSLLVTLFGTNGSCSHHNGDIFAHNVWAYSKCCRAAGR